MTDSGAVFCVGIDLNLTFVYNGLELVLNLCVQNFSEVFCTETCVESFFADTDTDHITLSGMHNAFDAVQVAVEFTLEYRLEIRLHALSGNLNNVCNAVLGTYLELVDVRSDQLDLVIFYFGSIFCLNQLAAVYAGTVKLNLHIAAADNLALECRCERNRNINVCDFNLNIACFQGSSVEFGNIFLDNQALRDSRNIFVIVCDNREAKCNRTSAACNDYVIQRSECVYECRYTVFGVGHQCVCIACRYITEDQSCTDCNRYNVDDRCYVFSKRDDTYICACLISQFLTLIDDSANQCYKNTLCLIALNQIHAFLCSRSASKDNSNTRDITSYKRYAKLTDDGIA